MHLIKPFQTTLPMAVRVLVFGLILIFSGCSKQSKDDSKAPRNEAVIKENKVNTVSSLPSTDKIWALGDTMLQTAELTASTLNTRVVQLLKQPNDENYRRAKEAWFNAAESFEHFYVLSRLGAVEAEHFKPLIESQVNLSAWPIQPGYLDAYGEHVYSGLIFDVGTPLDENALRQQHRLTDSEDATLGIYTIEFLLFGENNQRSYIMFKPIAALSTKDIADGYEKADELPRNRRRTLLGLQSKLLAQDAAFLRSIWSSTQPNSMSAYFQQRTENSMKALLNQAVLNTLTEQIVAIAGMLKSVENQNSEAKLRRSQQLADRIGAQLAGISKVINLAPDPGLQSLTQQSQSCSASVKKIGSLSPIGQDGKTSQANWQEGYNCIRQLTRELEFSPN